MSYNMYICTCYMTYVHAICHMHMLYNMYMLYVYVIQTCAYDICTCYMSYRMLYNMYILYNICTSYMTYVHVIWHAIWHAIWPMYTMWHMYKPYDIGI